MKKNSEFIRELMNSSLRIKDSTLEIQGGLEIYDFVLDKVRKNVETFENIFKECPFYRFEIIVKN